MNKKVAIVPRWYGSIPSRNGRPLPKNQWARAGRRRKWTVRWYAPNGSRPRQTFDTKEKAEAFARKKIAEFETRGPSVRCRPAQVTFGDFVDELLVLRTGARGRRISIGALREYRTVLTRFRDFIGRDMLLDQVTQANATKYVATLRSHPSRRGKPLSASSVNKHKQYLKSAFNVAVRQLGYLHSNPFDLLQLDKIAAKALRYISPDEFQALLDACNTCRHKSLWWEAFLTVCYTAGTRANEAAHLIWKDIDFEAGTITIIAKPDDGTVPAWQPKDYDPRSVPVPPRTVDILTRLYAEAVDGSSHVFLSPSRLEWIGSRRRAGRWSEGQEIINNLSRDFRQLAQTVRVPDATLHDLRRSCISHWAGSLSATVVRKLAGHADIKTTLKYYVTVRPADMAKASEVTARALLLDPK